MIHFKLPPVIHASWGIRIGNELSMIYLEFSYTQVRLEYARFRFDWSTYLDFL